MSQQADNIAAVKLRDLLCSAQSQPYQMLQEFQKYADLICREVIHKRLSKWQQLPERICKLTCSEYRFGEGNNPRAAHELLEVHKSGSQRKNTDGKGKGT
jgi:hypothetical protein